MGTIAQKLEYLNETKQELKEAINNLGGEIDNNTTFREYVEELQDIYDNLPKTSYGEGTNISLANTLKGKLDFDNLLYGDTKQDTLNGYQLWGGTTYSNTYFTTNSNGSISYKPTPSQSWSAITSEAIANNLVKTIPAGTYTFSIPSAPPTNIVTDIVKVTGTSGSVFTTLGASVQKYTFTITEEMSYFIRITTTGETTSTGTLYTMLESGSTKHDFEPYCGGIPSPNPNYPQDIQVVTGTQEIKVVGKNLIDFSKFTLTGTSRGTISTTSSSVTINMTGQFMAYVTSIPISNKTYKLSVSSISGSTVARIEIRLYKNGTQIGSTSTTTSNATIDNTSGNYDEIRISLSNATTTTTDITFNELQLEVGTSVTSYSPYTSTSYTISLGDIELAKIGMAKDYIYKSGDKWYKHQVIDEVIYNGDQTFTKIRDYVFSSPNLSNAVFPSNTSETMQCYCNYYTPIPNTATWNNYDYMISYAGGKLAFRNKDTQGSTDFESWLSTHNTKVKYIMVTPTDTEITNETLITELEALLGAYSKYGTTNIQVEGNLAGGLKVRALKGV